MKIPACAVALLTLYLTMATLPAAAQTLYDNGPTNGNAWAWDISYRAIVSSTFNLGGDYATISGASFAMWLYPNDTLLSAELLITSEEFGGGTVYFDQTVTFTQVGCISSNQYGYTVCQESTGLNVPRLNAGTYWLSLRNAKTNDGDPIYWDQNYGPSDAIQCCANYEVETHAVGTIPSESFTVLGEGTTTFARAR